MRRLPLLWLVVLVGCASSAPDDEPAERAQSLYDVINWFKDNGYVVRECGSTTVAGGPPGVAICLTGTGDHSLVVWTYGSERQARQAVGRIKLRSNVGIQPINDVGVRSFASWRAASVHQSGPIVVYAAGDREGQMIRRDLVRILGPAR